MNLRDVDARTALVLVIFVALPGWLLVFGPPQRVWGGAAIDLVQGESLYQLKPTDWNPHSTRYVYLPIFGIATAAAMAIPAVLADLAGIGEIAFKASVGHLVAGLWGPVSYGLLVYAAYWYAQRPQLDRRRTLAVAAVALFPMVPILSTYRGSDLLVAALFLGTLAAWHSSRWFDAGLLASLATFKFTGIPVLAVVVFMGLSLRDCHISRRMLTGVAVGQVPNLLYFGLYPDDLLMILRNGGALSTYAYRITDFHTLLLPVRWGGAESLYTDLLFPIVLLLFVALAFAVARRTNLLVGMLVAFFPMAYLLPAERRFIPFVVLLLVAMVELWDRHWITMGVVAMAAVRGYSYLFSHFDANRLGEGLVARHYVQQFEPILHAALLLAVVVAAWRVQSGIGHRGTPA